MGFGQLFTRPAPARPQQDRVIASFDVVNGQPVFGSEFGSSAEYSGGLAVPGAWRASMLLADLLGGVPWHAYRERAGRPPERLSPTPSFLEQPAPPDPRMVTFSSMALDLIWHGNAIAVIATRDRQGWPTSYLPVPAENVHVRRAREGDPAGVPQGSVVYDIGTATYALDDVLHVKGPCRPGALRGMGVLENHLNGALSLADEQARQARILGAVGIPTGVLKVDDTPDEPLDQTEADEVKAKWLRSQRDRTVAVLNSRTSFEALAWNPTETQLLEARKYSLHEIALIFGLDPSWMGVSTGSMTYQNTETKAIDLLKFSLNGHLARFEQTFTLSMPRGTWAKANLDSILRADTKTRYEAHKTAIEAGFLTADEVRALEDLPPLTPAQLALESDEGEPATRAVRDLLKYWVRGPGLVKWSGSSEPLSALYQELKSYMPAVYAKWTALAWFELAMGRAPVPADGQLPDLSDDDNEKEAS